MKNRSSAATAATSISTSRRSPRTSRTRRASLALCICACLALLASFFPATSVAGDGNEAFFLPSPEDFDRLGAILEAVELDSNASASSCTWDGAWRCECVIDDDLTAGLITTVELRDVALQTSFGRVWVSRYDRQTGRLNGVVVERDGSFVQLSKATRVDGQWALTDVRFSNQSTKTTEWSCDILVPDVDEQGFARAALQTEAGWRLEEYAIGVLPVGDVDPGVTESGLLPPTVRADADAIEFEAATYVAPLGALTLTAAPGIWYGGGVRIVSDGALDLQARYDVDQGVVPFAWGSAGYGGARQRLDATLEHPAPASHASLRRIESGAFLRSWRRSAAGVNLSGPTYGLAVEGGWVSRLNGSTDADLVATFGGASYPGEYVRLDFDLDQYSRTVDDASSHSTTAAFRIAVPFGRPTSVWATPAVGAYANYGVIPAQLGFEASASGGLFAEFETGASWTGRFKSFRHVMSPRLRVGRELVGIAQRAPLPADAPAYLFTRTPQFSWASIELENRLVGRSFDVVVPAGALGVGEGFDAVASPRPYIRPSLSWRTAELMVGAVCTVDCAEIAMFAEAAARWKGVDARLTVSRTSVDDLRVLAGASAFASPNYAIALSQSLSTERERVGRLALGWTVGELRLHALAASRPDTFIGTEGGLTWSIEPLGFGVGLLGGWRAEDGAWIARAGFQAVR